MGNREGPCFARGCNAGTPVWSWLAVAVLSKLAVDPHTWKPLGLSSPSGASDLCAFWAPDMGGTFTEHGSSWACSQQPRPSSGQPRIETGRRRRTNRVQH